MEQFNDAITKQTNYGGWNDLVFGARSIKRDLRQEYGDEVLRDGQLIVVNHFGEWVMFELMGHTAVINDNTNLYVRPGSEVHTRISKTLPYGLPKVAKVKNCRLPTGQEIVEYSKYPSI